MNSIISEGRKQTEAERTDESARMARARVTGGVRRQACPQCGTSPYGPCSASPPGDCLARWLRAFALCKITREDLINAVRGLVVISAAQLVEERAA